MKDLAIQIKTATPLLYTRCSPSIDGIAAAEYYKLTGSKQDIHDVLAELFELRSIPDLTHPIVMASRLLVRQDDVIPLDRNWKTTIIGGSYMRSHKHNPEFYPEITSKSKNVRQGETQNTRTEYHQFLARSYIAFCKGDEEKLRELLSLVDAIGTKRKCQVTEIVVEENRTWHSRLPGIVLSGNPVRPIPVKAWESLGLKKPSKGFVLHETYFPPYAVTEKEKCFTPKPIPILEEIWTP